ncbi:CTR copper uptake transporter [Chiua virens]|nr:CTR copper uptake transporter [Chiua virens]
MTPWPVVVALCFFLVPTLAQSNGMDMSMDTSMNLTVGNMLPYVHFTPGDTVWFIGWVPSSASAMVGVCIGVFLLSMFERWLAACLALAEGHWAESILVLKKSDEASSLPSSLKSVAHTVPVSNPGRSKWFKLPPFVPEVEVTRGVLFATHAFLKVLIMMVVMTFQLAFIFSIAIGSGVGETLFGRFSSSSLHEH